MKNNNKIYIKIIIFLVVFMLMILGIYHLTNSSKNEMSFDVKSESVDELNHFLEMIENNLKQNEVSYKMEKYKNKEIYSMLLTLELDPIAFDSYNVDLITKKSLTNSEVASKFNLTKTEILKKVEERIKKYYDEEVDYGYVNPNKCDFECYKTSHDILDYESYVLYVKNEKLYIYIGFDKASSLNDKAYFDDLEYNPYIIEI